MSWVAGLGAGVVELASGFLETESEKAEYEAKVGQKKYEAEIAKYQAQQASGENGENGENEAGENWQKMALIGGGSLIGIYLLYNVLG